MNWQKKFRLDKCSKEEEEEKWESLQAKKESSLEYKCSDVQHG